MAIVLFPSRLDARSRWIVIEVVDDDEVEPAVAIVVQEAAGCAPSRLLDAARASDLVESPIPPIAEEAAAAVLGDVNVHPAIVIDVADRDPHAVAPHVQPAARAGVAERAVGVLTIEFVGCRRVSSRVVQEE